MKIPQPNLSRSTTPAVLVIIDGFGLAPAGPGNAITQAKTPTLDRLYRQYPWTKLEASGSAVGLMPGQEGNSEAGHMNLAAGRIVDQDVIFISKRINDGIFFKNPAFLHAVSHVRKHRSRIHVMGLLSSGQSAHSHPDHLLALITFFRQQKIGPMYIHLFMDGRDSPPTSGLDMLKKLEKFLTANEQIASVSGRFWAMDRKKIWPRTQRAYDALVLGVGQTATSAEQAVQQSYAKSVTDEFIEPTVVQDGRRPVATIQDNDALIFFNCRSDRARQLTKSFVQSKFKEFPRNRVVKNLLFVALTDFGPDLENIVTAYPSPNLKGTLPMALKSLRQLYIAESEKFAHITYFFNGGYADPVAGEDRVMVASPNVDRYDSIPAMACYDLTKVVLGYLDARVYDFIGLNFANPDMVAHAGNLPASIAAVEVVDQCLGQLVEGLAKHRGILFVTADHGNIEELTRPDVASPDTEHSTNPVPLIVVGDTQPGHRKLKPGVLAQVAPTILETLGLPKPAEMTLPSLWQ